jgi:hypothetical protein
MIVPFRYLLMARKINNAILGNNEGSFFGVVDEFSR